ncbi:HAD family hydrolase [Mariniblastus fucicola]|uniref:Fructose-1-phosphate phosphatase YqaB n=1 Tax=Mariniblastus fucicola TaxID=980251 RepID=A0A5B9PNY5_9BACT|nr:beta-phosphoglucomutase family hydrolase [Mariniblastus fucicola]QEG24271.1 Fructose-1-phosphate phosphatase YqaB [Mariniblastus fucicola]
MLPNDDTEALIFDCDGTLADTMPLHFIAWQNVMTGYGFQFDEDLFYSLGGKPTELIVEDLSRDQNIDVDVMKVTNEKESAFLDLIDQIEPIKAVVGVAQQFHGKLPMGVGSGGQREVVKQILSTLSIEPLFDCVVGSEDTEKHKPEPDVFLEVASRLKVEPSKCLVYEDADLGVEAARRAGMQCFDVRTIFTPRRITSTDPGNA